MAEPAIPLVKGGDGVVLSDREGRLVTVSEADAAEVIGSGTYLPATQEQVQQREYERKYGGAAGKVAAGAAAATAGAVDAAIAVPKAITALGAKALGTQDPLAGIHGRGLQEDLVYLAGEAQGRSGERDVRVWREGVSGVAAANPYTTLAGRIAGEAVGSFGLAGAGRQAGTLAARGALAAGAGRGTANALGMAAQGAAEGAMLSQGQVSEEAYLAGDRETTAEKTLAGMGLGALLGGGVGLGMAGAARVFGRLGSRGATAVDSPHTGRTAQHERQLEDVAERVIGERPAPGFGAKFRAVIEDMQSSASGADRGTLKEFGALNWSEGARSARAMWRNKDAIIEGATAEITARADDLLKKAKAVTREVWEVPAKEAQVARNLASADDAAKAAMLDASRQATAQLRAEVQSIGQAMGPGAHKRYLADLDEWMVGIEGAVQRGDAGEAYIALDRAKRALQRKVDSLGATGKGVETNPLRLEQKLAVKDALEGAQENVRQFLMNEGVWGAQGAAQREANAAAERYLKVKNLFESGFGAQMGREYGGFGGAPIIDADPSKIGSFIGKLGRQEAALKDKVFREYVDSTLNLAESIGKGYKLEGASAKALEDLRGAARSIKDTLAKADKTVKVANQIDAVIEAEKGGAGGLLNSALGGGLLGGAPGAALGAALGVATRPGQMIRQMAAIEQLAANVDSKVARGVKGFFDGFQRPAKTAAEATTRKLPQAAKELPRRALMPSALEAFRGKESTAAAAYEKRAQELIQLSQGMGLTERTHAALGDLPSTAPRLSADIAGKASSAVAFLQSKMPSGTLAPTVIQPTRKAIPSDLEIAKFARYWTATTNPLSVFDELRHGTLTHEHVEAVRAVYPKLYEHMQTAALDSLRKAATDGVMVPYQARLQMALLLNLGAEADPTLNPDLMVRIDDYRKAQQEQRRQPPSGGKPMNIASRLRSGSETLTMASNEARR